MSIQNVIAQTFENKDFTGVSLTALEIAATVKAANPDLNIASITSYPSCMTATGAPKYGYPVVFEKVGNSYTVLAAPFEQTSTGKTRGRGKGQTLAQALASVQAKLAARTQENATADVFSEVPEPGEPAPQDEPTEENTQPSE